MKRVRLLISGIVQGVGFRNFIFRKARDLNVTGWIKNHTSGQRVEIVLEGNDLAVEKLVEECQRGPILSEISRVQVLPETFTGKFSEFEIKE